MIRVLILHAYSAANLGDGLLVRETIGIVREALGAETHIVVAASHPHTFESLNVEVLNSAPSFRGYDRHYLKILWNVNQFDLVVGVGGGYLRFGHPVELLKTTLVHGPQLLASSYRATRAVYMPQSIGPAKYGTRKVLARLLNRLDAVMLRDDRSMTEFAVINPHRLPDLATAGLRGPDLSADPDMTPVLSVRSTRGILSPAVVELSRRIGIYDAYVQSTSSGNDDRPVTALLDYRKLLDSSELMTDRSRTKVVVAVRLHAALMALRAGHFVVHLAYERKGFGAFDDLGLDDYVFNVNSFSVDAVLETVQALLSSSEVRQQYVASIERTRSTRETSRERMVNIVRASQSIHD